MVRERVRIRFGKRADLRLIGHRDLLRCLERLFRRAGLPLAMSEGFHPKPRMSFPLALGLGVEGLDEVMELELSETWSAERLIARLTPQLPPGLTLNSVEPLPPGAKKAQVRSVWYEVPLPPRKRGELADRVREFLSAASWPVQRRGRRTPLDLRPLVQQLIPGEQTLRMQLRIDPAGSARLEELFEAIGLADLPEHGIHPTRTSVELVP